MYGELKHNITYIIVPLSGYSFPLLKVILQVVTIINTGDTVKLRRAFLKHLLHAVPARSALFEKWNALFSTKTSKNTCRLRGCTVLNALNLEELWEKSTIVAFYRNFAFFWLYHPHALIFQNKPRKVFLQN